MKIYTKKGDEGTTGLYGGTRLSKDHLRIESYGTIDELNSWMGMLRDHALNETDKSRLIDIQNDLFVIGSHLASDPSKKNLVLPEFKSSSIDQMESWIDQMEEGLEPMKFFVLPGGHELVSYCHITRTVCRRAERLCVSLHKHENIHEFVLPFLNRLSDLLFVYSRYVSNTLNAEEIPWKPRA